MIRTISVRAVRLLCAALLLLAHLPVAHCATKTTDMHWSELGPFIAGRDISMVMPDGTFVRGRALAVNADALVLDVSKTSDRKACPKGRTSIPRSAVRSLSLDETRGPFRALTAVGGAVGGLLLSGIAAASYEDAGGGSGGFVALLIGAPVAGGFGGYYAGRPLDRKTTVIRVTPDITRP